MVATSRPSRCRATTTGAGTRRIDRAKLDPVFLEFGNKRKAMKNKFGGESLPSNAPNTATQTFLNFFQIEKFTGQAKGILLIVLTADPTLLGRA